jgi:endogenous inhibitor of DNA gyrase (YacG/DUF329 family)
MAATSSLHCSICKRPIERPPENKWFPFCSNRCRVIDLSKWLNEDYKVPALDDDADPNIDPESGGQVH